MWQLSIQGYCRIHDFDISFSVTLLDVFDDGFSQVTPTNTTCAIRLGDLL